MSDDTPARFAFKGKDLEVSFEGRADFVSAQVTHFRDAMLASAQATVRAAMSPAPAMSVSEDEGEATTPAAATPAAAVAPATAAPAGTASAAAPAAAPGGKISLEEFYKRAKSRSGRGALQETILIFAYFLREHRDMDEFGIDNLNACFSLVGVAPPRSLANTLGIMKRNLKLFDSGSRRGTYTLTDRGTAYVTKLIGG